jgi:hypothetical protein
MMEHRKIYQIIEERIAKPHKVISHEEMLRRLNIDANELRD